jgi:hypothetical protein
MCLKKKKKVNGTKTNNISYLVTLVACPFKSNCDEIQVERCVEE